MDPSRASVYPFNSPPGVAPFVVGEREIDHIAEVLEASITSAVARAEA
jgi:hypothetical protein